jgi:hypothetical protein
MKMIDLTTELPTDAAVHWISNGHCRWLEDEHGKMYRPPNWVYRLVDEAEKHGRNQVRAEIAAALVKEK